jgi:RHS repeat-associated protein
LGKYGDIPVNMQTGIPNVSIPLHTMNGTGGLSVPISMSYHAGGVRLSEMSSWVGLGWTLNAGGAITRSVRNAPDEGSFRTSGNVRGKSWLKTSATDIESQIGSAQSQLNLDLPNGLFDTEADAFSFNVNGITGKFYFKVGAPNEVYVVSASQDVSIKPHFESNNSTFGTFDYWELIAADGTKYIFGQENANEFDGSDKAVDLTANYAFSQSFRGSSLSVAAWYLTRIESADGLNKIFFTYSQERYRYTNRGSDVDGDTRTSSDKLVHSEVYAAKLAQISSPYETVDFVTKSANRIDLDNTSIGFNALFGTSFTTNVPRAAALEFIRVKQHGYVNNPSGSYYKKIKLNTSYLVSTLQGFPNVGSTDDFPSDRNRLYLQSVVVSDDAESAATKQEYKLTYNHTNVVVVTDGIQTSLPRRKSAAADYWGFYNGQTSNLGLMPDFLVYSGNIVDNGQAQSTFLSTSLNGELTTQLNTLTQMWGTNASAIKNNLLTNLYESVSFPGAPYTFSFIPTNVPKGNRVPVFSAIQEGVLTKIEYPTGGSSEFMYEANTYKGKTETLNFSYPTGTNLYANCAAPSGNCANRTLSVNTTITNLPSNLGKVRYVLYLKNLGSTAGSMQFNWVVKRNGAILQNGVLDLDIPQGVAEKVHVGNFISKFLNNSALNLYDNIEISITPFSNNGTTDKACDIRLQIFYPTLAVSDANKIGGGLRVKQVKSNDAINAANSVIKNYSYTGDDGFSSGVLFSKLNVLQNLNVNTAEQTDNFGKLEFMFRHYSQNAGSGNALQYLDTRVYVESGNILAPPVNNQSGLIGYKKVTVSQPSNGSSVYKYIVDEPVTSEPNRLPTYPAVPEFSISGKAGNLLREEHYNTSSTLVKSVDYLYEEVVSNSQFFGTNRVESYLFTPKLTGVKKYRVIVGYHAYLTRKIEMVDNVIDTTWYNYRTTDWAHHNVVETISKNSDNVTHSVKNYYAKEEGNTFLTDRNMVSIPLRTEKYVNNVLKSGSRTLYQLFGSFQRPAEFQSLSRTGTWLTKLTVNEYDDGLPKRTTAIGYSQSEHYYWVEKLLRNKYVGNLNELFRLTWEYNYKPNTALIEAMKDENGLLRRFEYDNMSRLFKTFDRVNPNNLNDVQATTVYDYHYKGQPTLNSSETNQNFVSTTTTFVNASNSTPLKTKQYFDGLGRAIEVSREQYTPSGLHQKNYMTYDALGRSSQSFLPHESSSIGFEVTSTPFRKTEYEMSPLSRPIKQIAEDTRSVQTKYWANASFSIRRFTITTNTTNGTNSVNPDGFYSANTLYRTTVWNENNLNNGGDLTGQTDIFKDKLGRIVLTRKYIKDANNNWQNVDTYNIYDDYGNLVMVIPPDATPANNGSGSIKLASVFEYNFDNKNRLMRKKVPNAAWQHFYYDNRDLLVLTQDGNMRAATTNQDKHLATIYDPIGRVIKTGFVTVLPTLGQDVTVTASQITELLTQTDYYDNKSWVKNNGAKVLKPLGISTVRNFMWSYIERRASNNYTGNPVWTGKQHLLSQTYRFGSAVGDDPITDNDLGGVDWSVSAYDGSQKPLYTLRYLLSGAYYGSSQEVRTWQSYQYDNGQRMTGTKYSFGLAGVGINDPTFTLANMVYNHKDQLTEKNTALTNGKYLQSTDFTYNNRGWLTSINSGFQSVVLGFDLPLFNNSSTDETASANYNTVLNSPLMPPAQLGEHNADLFKEIIKYDNPNTSLPNNGKTPTPQYNGNISQVEWHVAGREAQAYTYNYDNLDRLIEANYTDIHTAPSKWSGVQYSSDNKFQEKLTYDLRGNIQSLQRNGLISTNLFPSTNHQYGIFTSIDNLSYTYEVGNENKLNWVVDAANTTRGFKTASNGAILTYDANGNLTSDKNKKILSISYNYLNLPLAIVFGQEVTQGNITSLKYLGNIEFIYDANGVKLRKTIVNVDFSGAEISRTTYDYVNGVEYKNGAFQRLAHTEGGVVMNTTTNQPEHEYHIKDHLGNVRVTYGDAGNDGTLAITDVKQINHYYPFGLNMEGNWNGAQGQNKYQYNSKEWNDDFGLALNDYGARWYDGAIGRWTSVDPMSEMRNWVSPYQYVQNNPIKSFDPTGMLDENFSRGRKESGQESFNDEYFRSNGEKMSAANASWRNEPWGRTREVEDSDKKDKNDVTLTLEYDQQPEPLYLSTTIKLVPSGKSLDQKTLDNAIKTIKSSGAKDVMIVSPISDFFTKIDITDMPQGRKSIEENYVKSQWDYARNIILGTGDGKLMKYFGDVSSRGYYMERDGRQYYFFPKISRESILRGAENFSKMQKALTNAGLNITFSHYSMGGDAVIGYKKPKA